MPPCCNGIGDLSLNSLFEAQGYSIKDTVAQYCYPYSFTIMASYTSCLFFPNQFPSMVIEQTSLENRILVENAISLLHRRNMVELRQPRISSIPDAVDVDQYLRSRARTLYFTLDLLCTDSTATENTAMKIAYRQEATINSIHIVVMDTVSMPHL